jgi:hypothetical protein
MLYLEYRSTKLFCAKNSLLNIHGLHSFIFSYSSTRDDLMVEDSHPIPHVLIAILYYNVRLNIRSSCELGPFVLMHLCYLVNTIFYSIFQASDQACDN